MTDWETRYYEAEANHTEANGMLTAENARLRRALSEGAKLRDEMRIALEAGTKRSREQGSEIGNLTQSLVMARSMLRSLVNGWLSDTVSETHYDQLAGDARALLDVLDRTEATK